jgi:hypothetical protein
VNLVTRLWKWQQPVVKSGVTPGAPGNKCRTAAWARCDHANRAESMQRRSMQMELHHGLLTRGRRSDERQTVRRLEVDDVAARGHRSGLFNRERLDVNILVLVRFVG